MWHSVLLMVFKGLARLRPGRLVIVHILQAVAGMSFRVGAV